MILGVVGAEGRKWTHIGETVARAHIVSLIDLWKPDLVVSGACPEGGIDVWSIEEAIRLGVPTQEFAPAADDWLTGYKPRNIAIAVRIDRIYTLSPRLLPNGQPWYCYHCHTGNHVRSGGCWTVKHAQKLGKPGELIVVP